MHSYRNHYDMCQPMFWFELYDTPTIALRLPLKSFTILIVFYIVIPIEIVKRGPEVVKKYKQALREGKVKIPRCGLLFLGQERKGKTSLYKLLVGKDFDLNQDSTQGIDNNEVDTVDSREITIEWCEKSKDDQVKERERLHASAIIREIPPNQPQKEKKTMKFQIRSKEELLGEIDIITAKIAKLKIHAHDSSRRPPQTLFTAPVESRHRMVSHSRPLEFSFPSPAVHTEEATPSTKPAEPPKPKPENLPPNTHDIKLPKPVPKPSTHDQSKTQQSAPGPIVDESKNPPSVAPQASSGSSYSDVKSISKALKQPDNKNALAIFKTQCA